MIKDYKFKHTVFVVALLLHLGFISPSEIIIKSIDSDNIITNKSNSLILSGNVVVKTDEIELWSDTANYDQKNQTLELIGNIKALSKNLLTEADYLLANISQQSFVMNGAKIDFLKRVTGSSDQIKIFTSGKVELLNTSFSSCKPEKPFWVISTDRITLLENKRNVEIEGLKLKIANIPIIYIPYLTTTVGKERFSGFLTPSVHQSKDGLDLSIPYYLNIAPNIDMTLGTRLIQKRGSGLFAELRYLNSNSTGELSIAGITKDKIFRKESKDASSRWGASWFHRLLIGNSFTAEALMEDVSDLSYFKDIDDDFIGGYKKDFLKKNISLSWFLPNTEVNFRAKQDKSLSPFSLDAIEIVPSIDLKYFLRNKNISYGLDINFSKFKSRELILEQFGARTLNVTTINPAVEYKKDLPSSRLSISLGIDEVRYKNEVKDSKSSSPWAEIEYKIFLQKSVSGKTENLSPIVKYIHIKDDSNEMYPNIDSRRMSRDFQNLFQRSWFSGNNNLNNNDRFIIGFEKYVNKNKGLNGYFSLGKSYSLQSDDSQYEINDSVIGQYNYRLSEKIWLNGLVNWDTKNKKIESAFSSIAYNNGKQKRLEIKASFKRRLDKLDRGYWLDKTLPTNYGELNLEWPLNNKISVFGKIKNDIDRSKSQDLIFGFQYSNCCFKAGLMKRKWVQENYFLWQESYQNPFYALAQGHEPSQNQDNIYLFLEFKELGRFGKEISKIISSTKLD
jgi:LPS-assembly protein